METLPDTNQNAWQLASIQLTGVTSLPVLAGSILLIQKHDFTSAIINLVLGNIILYFIRLGIVLMSHGQRKSTLDIARDYVGNVGGYCIAILLLLSTLAWFVAQTTLATNALTFLIPLNEGSQVSQFMQFATIMGVLSTLCCMEGIKVLRWLSVIALPLLLAAFVGAIITSPHHAAPAPTPFSFAGLAIVVGTSLGVTADLPTFFRHSRSKRTSLHALTLITIISVAIGFGGLYLGDILNPHSGLLQSTLLTTPMRISLIGLIFLSALLANVANVYSASVGWELVAPVLAGRKEYLILGLGLTTIFILVANIFTMDFLLNSTDNSLVNLCMILVIGYLVSLYQKRPPSTYEQTTYFFAWLMASALNALQFSGVILPTFNSFLSGTALLIAIVAIALALSPFLQRRWPT